MHLRYIAAIHNIFIHIFGHYKPPNTEPETYKTGTTHTPPGAESIDTCTSESDDSEERSLKPMLRRRFNHKDIITVWRSVYNDAFSTTCKLCAQEHIELETRTGIHAWEISHVIPLAAGGSNDISNLRPLCKHCNRSMGKKTFLEYINLRYPHRISELTNTFKLPLSTPKSKKGPHPRQPL
jgi:Restriction endonuclease